MLANQLVDKFQSKEGAQAALKEIERFLEGGPPMLSSGPDVLAIEYEAVITPHLQVSNCKPFFLYIIEKERTVEPSRGELCVFCHLAFISFCPSLL